MGFNRGKFWMVLAVLVLAISSSATAQFRVSITFGPPAIPVYEQPLCPGEGYIWTPGYWAWDDDSGDYYWVPGTWVVAPQVGYLWTPAWWGWEGGVYVFHAGYWGPHVGFYGGINYGYGYFGDGYRGGRWRGDHFYYNREVTNVNITNITNVYNERVRIINNSRVSYHGGQGGLTARATREQRDAEREHHIEALTYQRNHEQLARRNPELRAATNHGRPPIAATEKPGDFNGRFVGARDAGGPYNRPDRNPANTPDGKSTNRVSYGHPKELPPPERLPAPNSGNAKWDKKYQQQQDKLFKQQEHDRVKLQKQQDNEHAKMQRQNKPPEFQQRVEQKHEQQTQSMTQRHTDQRARLQQKETKKH